MGLISPGGENLLDFFELGQVLSSMTDTSGTRSDGLSKVQFLYNFLLGPWDSSPVNAGA